MQPVNEELLSLIRQRLETLEAESEGEELNALQDSRGTAVGLLEAAPVVITRAQLAQMDTGQLEGWLGTYYAWKQDAKKYLKGLAHED